ncbi:MAG TPA: hypothetical protein VMY76_06820 [Gemmatimonadales bacterium]|nr:hypothetical protein [Gemmatimonadales bacterium]
MHRTISGALAVVVLAWSSPLVAQGDGSDWQLAGLRSVFCVQLLMDPASDVVKDLPAGFRPAPASESKDLHISLRSVIDGQPEYASWSPSHLCFHAVDTIQTSTYRLGNGNPRRPQLFGYWTVTAVSPSGEPRDVTLELFASSGRLVRSARLAGQTMREARLEVGKVPETDENGVPSTEDRFQVRLGKSLVTWDGHLAGDRLGLEGPVTTAWVNSGPKKAVAEGRVTLRPRFSRAMVGSLKVEGKDALAKALRASPTRFAGPVYWGGTGKVEFKP